MSSEGLSVPVMATTENDTEDCQMQPLDLSCPKHESDDEDLSPRLSHRPRSSSGGSDESSEFDPRPRDLVKAAALLRNCWPAAAAGLTPILIDGPARKRFLTKYLHKSGEIGRAHV